MTLVTDHAVSYPGTLTSALCLTFDLDAHTMWTSKDPVNAERPAVLSSGDYDVGQGLDLVLGLLRARGVRTTFFVPLDVARAQPAALAAVTGDGHEVAMHGVDHKPLPDRSYAAERTTLGDLKDELEQLAQSPVRGYRAPLYDVTDNTRRVLAEIGCTFSSNYMDRVHPYVVDTGAGQVVEAPVHWMLDDGPYLLFASSPPNHRQFISNEQVGRTWTPEMRAISRLGGVSVFVLHPQLVGRPSRLHLLDTLLDAADDVGEVWLPTVGELATHLLQED